MGPADPGSHAADTPKPGNALHRPQDREKSLRERARIDPRSPVLLLDNLLAPFRVGQKKTISQIPPRAATAPILSVDESCQRSF
jgi:hypothetical protein